MPVAIELFLDESSADVVRQIWRDIAAAEISPYLHTSGVRPHLTLAVAERLPSRTVVEVLQDWAKTTSPIEVSFTGLGLSLSDPANVYLTATVSAKLLELHAALHQRLPGLLDGPSERSFPGRWVPHCTLIERVPNPLLGRTLDIARAAPLPLTARLGEVGLVEWRPLVQHAAFQLTG